LSPFLLGRLLTQLLNKRRRRHHPWHQHRAGAGRALGWEIVAASVFKVRWKMGLLFDVAASLRLDHGSELGVFLDLWSLIAIDVLAS
jgi:hypothetical protein